MYGLEAKSSSSSISSTSASLKKKQAQRERKSTTSTYSKHESKYLSVPFTGKVDFNEEYFLCSVCDTAYQGLGELREHMVSHEWASLKGGRSVWHEAAKREESGRGMARADVDADVERMSKQEQAMLLTQIAQSQATDAVYATLASCVDTMDMEADTDMGMGRMLSSADIKRDLDSVRALMPDSAEMEKTLKRLESGLLAELGGGGGGEAEVKLESAMDAADLQRHLDGNAQILGRLEACVMGQSAEEVDVLDSEQQQLTEQFERNVTQIFQQCPLPAQFFSF